MNKFIKAIKDLDLIAVEEILQREPKWLAWQEDNGKNALHYLCGVEILKAPERADTSLEILKLLLKSGMDINSIHNIPDSCDNFPATPLWYAYTRGRNEQLFTYLLANGANPDNCMYAIAWYDDVESATLFKNYGAATDDGAGDDTPFMAAFNWKRFSIVEWFLKNGANVNFADSKGNTALFYAVKRKYKTEQIELLLDFGADFNQGNKEGISPKKQAELNKQKKILSLFIPKQG